jgi:hypothetical protein
MVFSLAISIWYGTILAPILEPGNCVGESGKRCKNLFENRDDLPGHGYTTVSRQGEMLRFDRRLPSITNVMKKNAV